MEEIHPLGIYAEPPSSLYVYYIRSYAWCWLNGKGGGRGILGSRVQIPLSVELIPGGVDSACHPSEVGKMSASMLVSFVGVATRPGLCPIAKETA